MDSSASEKECPKAYDRYLGRDISMEQVKEKEDGHHFPDDRLQVDLKWHCRCGPGGVEQGEIYGPLIDRPVAAKDQGILLPGSIVHLAGSSWVASSQGRGSKKSSFDSENHRTSEGNW